MGWINENNVVGQLTVQTLIWKIKLGKEELVQDGTGIQATLWLEKKITSKINVPWWWSEVWEWWNREGTKTHDPEKAGYQYSPCWMCYQCPPCSYSYFCQLYHDTVQWWWIIHSLIHYVSGSTKQLVGILSDTTNICTQEFDMPRIISSVFFGSLATNGFTHCLLYMSLSSFTKCFLH